MALWNKNKWQAILVSYTVPIAVTLRQYYDVGTNKQTEQNFATAAQTRHTISSLSFSVEPEGDTSVNFKKEKLV